MANPFIIDPALQAEVIRQFNLRGELAPFQLTNQVVPTFDIGRLASIASPQVVTTTMGSSGVRIGLLSSALNLQVIPDQIDFGDQTDGRTAVNPAAGTVLVDSGQLLAQNHVIRAECSANVPVDFRLEWRDAADAATLASWTVFHGGPSSVAHTWGPFNVRNALNERFRIVNISVVVGTVASNISAVPVFASFAT